MRTEVRTEPNPQVLGSVLCEDGPDPYLQVRGPSLSGADLRVEPGSDLVRTSRKGWKEIEVSRRSRVTFSLLTCHVCHISHITQRRLQHHGQKDDDDHNSCSCSCHRQRGRRRPQLQQLRLPTRRTTTAAAAATANKEDDGDHSCSCSCQRR